MGVPIVRIIGFGGLYGGLSSIGNYQLGDPAGRGLAFPGLAG